MKRILLTLMVAGLALASVPRAFAAVPGECGKSYAFVLNGAQPSSTQADGTATLPGALTAAVGVGVISFDATCTTILGEMIFNSGDIQGNPAGLSFGPAACYDALSAFGTGVPCFDGTNHFTTTSFGPSSFGNGAYDLKFNAGYNWIDASDAAGAIPFEFTLQNALGSAVVVGNSVASPTAQVLTITMQKIGVVPVGTTYGVAPYVGNEVLSCNAYGANQTDFIAGQQDPPGIAGSFGSTVGALQIFSTGQAGGSLSFNSNDNIQTSGTVLNSDCAFQSVPGTAFGSPSSTFADGTSNTVAEITSAATDPNCTDAAVAGAGYSTSGAVWGSTDKNGYTIVTGLLSTATGFVPPGGMSTCTTMSNGLTGTVTNLVAPASATANGTTVTYPIKLTSTSPASCDITFALSGSTTDGICTVALPGGTSAVVPGNTASTQYSSWSCTCAKNPPADAIAPTLDITSSNCPLSGTTSHVLTCRNSASATVGGGGGSPQ
jgi:hypothetical protein